uniref:Leader peptide n=1 Tax=Macrococcoides canis TaxID=1855823 RepID=A0A6G5ZZP1_9STAP|nr:leader peptide [Macrococcus canis]QHW12373.1 leader peptide [Macrococcus canis]
MTHAMKLRF